MQKAPAPWREAKMSGLIICLCPIKQSPTLGNAGQKHGSGERTGLSSLGTFDNIVWKENVKRKKRRRFAHPFIGFSINLFHPLSSP